MNSNTLYIVGIIAICAYGGYLVLTNNTLTARLTEPLENQPAQDQNAQLQSLQNLQNANVQIPNANQPNAFLPNTSKNNFSIKTEGDFIDFVENMYKILNSGKLDSSAANFTNKIAMNASAIMLISQYAFAALDGIQTKEYNELSTTYPNMIKSPTDCVTLFEMYFTAQAIHMSMKQFNNVDLTSQEYTELYNSEMNLLTAFERKIVYFHGKRIKPPNVTEPSVQNNADTAYYA